MQNNSNYLIKINSTCVRVGIQFGKSNPFSFGRGFLIPGITQAKPLEIAPITRNIPQLDIGNAGPPHAQNAAP